MFQIPHFPELQKEGLHQRKNRKYVRHREKTEHQCHREAIESQLGVEPELQHFKIPQEETKCQLGVEPELQDFKIPQEETQCQLGAEPELQDFKIPQEGAFRLKDRSTLVKIVLNVNFKVQLD